MEKPILHEPSPKKIFTLASPPNEPLRDLDCNTLSNTPGPKCRRGIFKVPSQPVIRRCSTTTSFLKRPDRPRDCPSPVMNKRARSCSIAVSSPSTTTASLIRPEVGLFPWSKYCFSEKWISDQRPQSGCNQCAPTTWHKHKTCKVRYDLSNPEYHMLANDACQKSVVHLHGSQAQFCYARHVLFCLDFFFFFFNNKEIDTDTSKVILKIKFVVLFYKNFNITCEVNGTTLSYEAMTCVNYNVLFFFCFCFVFFFCLNRW